jgi:hypothetical protein
VCLRHQDGARKKLTNDFVLDAQTARVEKICRTGARKKRTLATLFLDIEINGYGGKRPSLKYACEVLGYVYTCNICLGRNTLL